MKIHDLTDQLEHAQQCIGALEGTLRNFETEKAQIATIRDENPSSASLDSINVEDQSSDDRAGIPIKADRPAIVLSHADVETVEAESEGPLASRVGTVTTAESSEIMLQNPDESIPQGF